MAVWLSASFALLLSVAYLRTGSILVCVVMHALFNTVTLLAVLLIRGAPH